MFALWTASVFLFKQGQETDNKIRRYGFLMTLLPALFMTMVCVSYILIAPEGIHLAPANHWIGYLIAGIISASALCAFCVWSRKYEK
jgi:carbon starvation protein CstA